MRIFFLTIVLITFTFTNSLFAEETPTSEIYKEFYDNGLLKAEGLLKDNKRDGFYKFYYENGALQTEAFYKDGLLETLKHFSIDGKMKVQEDITKDIIKNFYDNGMIKYEDYKGGYKAYYESGELKSEKDIPGRTKYFSKSGKLIEECDDTHCKRYDEKGKLISNKEIEIGERYSPRSFSGVFKLKTIADGIHKTYHNNGGLKCISVYKNGKKEGMEKCYEWFGMLEQENNYIEGGYVNKRYDKNGQLIETKEYKIKN